MLKALLHFADLSNPAKPWALCKRWSDAVIEEFFAQGDLEKQEGLPVSPNMDRETTNQAQLSLNFCDFIVAPFMVGLQQLLPPCSSICRQLTINRLNWEAILLSQVCMDSMQWCNIHIISPPPSLPFSSCPRTCGTRRLCAGTVASKPLKSLWPPPSASSKQLKFGESRNVVLTAALLLPPYKTSAVPAYSNIHPRPWSCCCVYTVLYSVLL